MGSSAILHWSYRDFRRMPEVLRECQNQFVEVYLKENFIPDIPVWFCEEMTQITFLSLAGNLIRTVPEQFSNLRNLEFLDLSQNSVEILPNTFGQLRNLTRLKLNDNQLSCLPKEMGELAKLECLELARNKLTVIPIELANCVELKELLLDENYGLLEIPTKIFTLPQLEFISAERCNLFLLPNLMNEGTPKLVRLFNNLPLSHYPLVLEKYLPPDYSLYTSTDFRGSHKPLNRFQLINCEKVARHLSFPSDVTLSHRAKVTNSPSTLLETCLRICNSFKIPDHWLPCGLDKVLANGPITRCGSLPCSKLIFLECVLVLFKR
ncbi:uncharacterized protein LOC129747290 [Uranotaenia lowii]|uniref:uncharacterized protein LOC129747290 n=1 Tax=Uranotaenia lowii TaxID=190385 RepID=UPI002478990D|nr:uncharacterized protein LOC129747290 [Uranotaenia lowii]